MTVIKRQYVVIGKQVANSLSPKIHQAFARQFNLPINYGYLEVQAQDFNSQLQTFIKHGGKGANITAPFKSLICAQIAEFSLYAQQAKAVNTITIRADGTLFGDNTDGIGFLRDISLRHAMPIKNQRIIILGAGGAVRGIIQAIFSLSPRSVTLVNRDLTKAQKLVNDLAITQMVQIIPYAALANLEFDIIINATSAWCDNKVPEISDNLNFVDKYCYDLNYQPQAQAFLKFAQHRGAKQVANGLGILVEQAAEAFYIWHRLLPDAAAVYAQLQA